MTPPRLSAPPARVLLGLGANLGDPAAQLARAVLRLGDVVRVTGVSSLYRSEPVGFREQPDFLNAVCAAETTLSPAELLVATQAVEREMGREPSFRNGPRPLDIDLLAYDGLVLDSPDLVLPHPGIAHRGFVLHPLAEVAPGWRHPVLDRTARELLLSAPLLERVERWGPPPALP